MSNIDPAEIQRRVKKRYAHWSGVLFHLAAYIGGSLFLWGIWVFQRIGILQSRTAPDRDLWPLVVMLGWGIVVLAHGIGVLVYPWWQASQANAIRRETEREMLRLQQAGDNKPKRGAV